MSTESAPIVPVSVGGAQEAGRVAELGASGVLDNTMMPAAVQAVETGLATAQASLNTLLAAAISAGAVAYSSLALLNADLAHGAGVLGFVYNDGTASNNGVYAKTGASGVGAWAFSGITIASVVHLSALGADVLAQLLSAVFDTSGPRYFRGSQLQFAEVDVNYQLSDGVLINGTGFNFGAQIGISNGLGVNALGQLCFGPSEGTSPIGDGGDVFEAAYPRYFHGAQIQNGECDSSYQISQCTILSGAKFDFGLAVGVSNGLTLTGGMFGLGTVADVLPLGRQGDGIDSSGLRYMRGTQIDFGSVDVNFDIATAVKIDGTFYSYGSGSGVSSLDAPAFSTSWSISSAQVTGFQQLFKASIVNGVGPIQITSTGNNANPAVTPDNTAVVYSTDRFGDRRLMYQLLAGSAMSTEYAVSALTSFVMIGDSLTAGVGASPSTDGFAYLIAANFARAYTIAARGGQTSRQIATRVGALAVTATVSGNSIASGSNSITALNGVAIAPSSGTDYQWMSTPADDNTTTSTGTIMTSPPVHGTFTRTATGGPPSTAEAYSFTPDAGYSLPIACAANTPIVLDTLTYDQQTVFICVGTNDFTNPSQVIASITALVAWYKPLVKKLMILTPLDLGQTVNSQTGGSLNTAISSLCATILSTWPNYAVDVRTPLLDGTGKIATANIDSGSGHPDNAGHALMAAAAIASATTRNF